MKCQSSGRLLVKYQLQVPDGMADIPNVSRRMPRRYLELGHDRLVRNEILISYKIRFVSLPLLDSFQEIHKTLWRAHNITASFQDTCTRATALLLVCMAYEPPAKHSYKKGESM
jgi:hypothetical protein